jgi:LPS-assembly protein
MSHYNPLPGGVRSYLDLDIVSDQDYLREFRKGYMGYEETDLFFQRFLGRQIDDYDDPLRTNRLLLDKSWSWFYLSAGTLLYDDVRKGQNRKETTQRLPVVRGIAPKQQILESPFFSTVNSEYVNFYQDRGYQVQRMDVWPRLYYPYALPPYVSIEPSVGFRQTIWDQYATAESDPWSDDRYFHRELYDTRLALSTDFYRVFNVDGDTVQKIKHSVRPEVVHTYVPEVSQDNLPNITARDRIENRNRVTYALTNTLTSKSLTGPERNEDHPLKANQREVVTSPGDFDYRDFTRLKVSQYYDFARHDEPFSPVTGKLTFFPGGKISLDTEASYNVYEDRLERYNAAVTLWARRNDRLFVQYRYDRNTEDTELDEYESGGFIEEDETTDETEVNSLYTSLRLGLTDRLSLVGSYERDFVFERPASYSVGVIYETQCWTIAPLFFKEEEDVGFGLRVRLKGIGEVGF